MIKKRNLVAFILLNVITLGIYGIVQFCIMGNEINKICDGDGKKQMHFLLASLLGTVTFGIYTLYWYYTAMERLRDNAYRYGGTAQPPHSGSSFLLWLLLGSFIVVGPIVAMCQFIEDVNAYAGVYGNTQPLPYTENMVERQAMINNGMNSFNNVGYAPAYVPPINVNVVANPAPVAEPAPAADSVPVTSFAPGYKPVNAQGVLECISGMYQGIPFPIVDGDAMKIGTNATACNIVINDEKRIVSGTHCIVSFSATTNTYTVTDCSTNGTYIDDFRIQPNVPVTVNKGSVMYLGDNRNMFRFN